VSVVDNIASLRAWRRRGRLAVAIHNHSDESCGAVLPHSIEILHDHVVDRLFLRATWSPLSTTGANGLIFSSNPDVHDRAAGLRARFTSSSRSQFRKDGVSRTSGIGVTSTLARLSLSDSLGGCEAVGPFAPCSPASIGRQQLVIKAHNAISNESRSGPHCIAFEIG
jgi:hypothetical protein